MKLRVSSANFTLEGGSLQIVENDGLVWLHYIYNTSFFVPTNKQNLQSIDLVHDMHVKCGCAMQSFLFY